jgi:trehalose synthase
VIELIQVRSALTLEDYEAHANLRAAVHELRAVGEVRVPVLSGRKVWMVSSTARGGGVAEMTEKLVALLRQLGVPIEWAVISTPEAGFFPFTKRLHNLIHGKGDPFISPGERTLYEKVSRDLADELSRHIGADDILVVHDPQPAGVGALLKIKYGGHSVWRCHIGLDRETPETRAAWEFLAPYIGIYDHTVFSAAEYIPSYLPPGSASVIHPAIDPLSHKNRDLSPIKTTGILCNGGLLREYAPVLSPPFAERVTRLRRDGTFGPADEEEIGLLFRPAVVQVSRWDRLKGWSELLEGFRRLKQRAARGELVLDEWQRRRLEIVRLLLVGPDPTGVADDPEAVEVVRELSHAYGRLEPEMQDDVALLLLPMGSVKINALMVNVIQRAASVVVQNSIEEGFGLVVTEAMWKKTPVLGSTACGIRQQIRDRVDGLLIDDPTDPDSVAESMFEILSSPETRSSYARTAQRRVHDEFLIFSEARRWIDLLWSIACGGPRRRVARPAGDGQGDYRAIHQSGHR